MSQTKRKRPAVITTKILEILENGAIETISIFTAITTSGYSSVGRMQGRQREIHDKLSKFLAGSPVEASRRKHNFSSLISRLKRDGLIKNKEGELVITKLGLEKLEKLKTILPLHKKYKKEPSNDVIIFMFDVPENKRRIRAWLRRKLNELSFKLVQKSVFVGKVKLPEEFMNDIKKFGAIDYVDIFTVSKKGSLKQIV